mgnify:CR=1 FL=1
MIGNSNVISYCCRELLEQAEIEWNTTDSTQELPAELPRFQVYTLDTTNIIRKYIGTFDHVFSMWSPVSYSCALPWLSFRSMQAHHSQFVWFRRLFVLFSRYGDVNTLSPLVTGEGK